LAIPSGAIWRAAIRPVTATPTNAAAEIHHRCRPAGAVSSYRQAPPTDPATIATTVVMPISPLAAEMRSGRTISGMLPNLDGPNRALCAPSRKTTPNISQRLPLRIAPTPRISMTSSASLQLTITVRLLNRSARYPAVAASRR